MQMTPFFPILGKLAYDANNLPPISVREKEYVDPFGNHFRMCLHKTPSTGVATVALAPVGLLQDSLVIAGLERNHVTADVSQSNVTNVVGAQMVALSQAETLAGFWVWVLVKGNAKDYAAGGRALPLGNPSPSGAFAYASPYTPVVEYPTDGNIADGSGLIWGDDNVWDPATDAVVACVAGRALAADTSTAIAAHLVEMDCPQGLTFIDTGP